MSTLKLRKTAPTVSKRPPVRHSSTARRPNEVDGTSLPQRPASPKRTADQKPDSRAPRPKRAIDGRNRSISTTSSPNSRRVTGARSAPAAQAKKAVPTSAPSTPKIALSHPPGSVRLSKRMSELGLTSRREADEWIERGWVRVDGVVVSQLGSRVLPHQQISVDRRAAQEQAGRVTILLNKPVGFVSGQAERGYKPALTLITPDNRWTDDPAPMRFRREHLRGLAPAGRLDIDSVGLLVYTQDGRTAKQLIGAASEVDKEYLVRVRYTRGGRLPDTDLALLNHGLELDGVPLRPAEVRWQNEDQLRFVLREGRKRQIRRMCEAVGLEVLGLKRVRIGRVRLGKLPPGQWRYLGPDEGF